MARIVILQHAMQGRAPLPYMILPMAELWRARGHEVTVHHGARDAPPADLAILHVDLTVVPQPMREALARYPRVVNGHVLDISKRKISAQLVDEHSDWPGPVLVKTDTNAAGDPERRIHALAKREGFTPTMPAPPPLRDYPVYPSLREVPAAVWQTPGLVVEKFLPERDERGYCMRVWTFLGDRDRCRRVFSDDPIVKSRSVTGHEACEVPEALRRRRQELGFDYGKFDFVIHDGECVLLDANRTPFHPSHVDAAHGPVPDLEGGLEYFLR